MTAPLRPGDPGTVAVVGLGRLGAVLADRLAERLTVLLHDADPKVTRQVAVDLSLPDMEPRELLAAADTVLLCVPPAETARVLRRLATLARQLGRRPLFVNMATSVPTHELPDVGLEVVGLKPVCQFAAVALGLKTVLVTSAPHRIGLLRTLAADLGEVVLGPEEVVGPANRAATKASLRACAELAAELTERGLPAELVKAAIRNVFVGTALDYPPPDSNTYTRSVLDELAAEAVQRQPSPTAPLDPLGWAAWAERPVSPGGPA
ncbi:NAD(P)-binding domain-containing protein [Kitasatospora brasiliensis]|uniref:NAD(P)-binding domain-containing protein n=1 Tax=Kitasatospora brasiliensis TaxID=3058040 RepID=UPI00292D121B|nr:NAD(P)-binding domain-containing protein [Kitasatospora sp. K002]